MKHKSYFLRLADQTPTEFWINNPTREQTDLALSHGATGCTNNPSYTQKMIDHPVECSYALQILDETIREIGDDHEAIAEFQCRMVRPVAEKFLPLFEKSGGRQGYVSIQGDPIREDDPDIIIREAMENRKLLPEYLLQNPYNRAGFTGHGIPDWARCADQCHRDLWDKPGTGVI